MDSAEPAFSAAAPGVAAGDPLLRAGQLRRQDPKAALVLAREALARAEAQDAPAQAAAARQLCALLHFDLSDYEAARREADSALSAFEGLRDPAGRIDSHEVLGKAYEKLGQGDPARAHHEAALALGRQSGDGARVARSLLSLGILRYNASDYPAAVAHYLEALALAQAAGEDHDQGRAQGCLGNAFERMGDYAVSLEHHQRCLQHFDEASHPRERSFALNNIGNVHLALGDYRQAIDFHQQSLALKRRLHDRWGEGTSLQNLGNCHLALGDLDGARGHFEHSLAIAEQIADQEGIAQARQGLGDIASRRGELDAAVAAYVVAQQISSTLGDRYNEVATLLCLGRVFRQQGRFEAADTSLQRALALGEHLQTRRLSQQVQDEFALLREAMGEHQAALAHLREAYRLERAVFSEDLEGQLRNLKQHFELEAAEQEKELHRLRHVELARANEELRHSNAQKERLLRTLERQRRLLQHQSTRDVLTGLYNRRHFDREQLRAVRLARRQGSALSVAICDIDDFKRINDRFSHQMGDAVLKAVARLLEAQVRTTDVVARYGGEEFALLLPETVAEHAGAVCESIRAAVADHPWPALHPALQVTISIGVADELGPADAGALMAEADRRLYRAKHTGKNRVVNQA